MNILVLGSGGREHAISWKISQSSRCNNLYVAPGNAGTTSIAENIDLSVTNFLGIKQFIVEKEVAILVVGAEVPLVEGIADYFEQELPELIVIGPKKEGAMLEGSKAFSKAFMQRHNIPTASYKSFDSTESQAAITYIKKQNLPIVIKADGLAAGKGVLICQSHKEAEQELIEVFNHSKFGAAGNQVVIEEFLTGIEYSVFVLTDGNSYRILPTAKDYKRIGEGDTGLNTGGMGAISPVPFVNDELMQKTINHVINPTIQGLLEEGIDYKGFIYFGLMNVNGSPFVIEYNCRMGDPETQVVFPRIKNDIVELFEATGKGTLATIEMEEEKRHAATVVLASTGYPGSYEKGRLITGLEQNEMLVFHAGTKENGNAITTSGGRVLAVTGLGYSLEIAVEIAKRGASQINFEGKYYRKDIGFDVVNMSNEIHK